MKACLVRLIVCTTVLLALHHAAAQTAESRVFTYQIRSENKEKCAKVENKRLVAALCDKTKRKERPQVMELLPAVRGGQAKHLIRNVDGLCLRRNGAFGSCKPVASNKFDIALSMSSGVVQARIVHQVGKAAENCLTIRKTKLVFVKCNKEKNQVWRLNKLKNSEVEQKNPGFFQRPIRPIGVSILQPSDRPQRPEVLEGRPCS